MLSKGKGKGRVETTGFEPATPALQRRCSTNWATFPFQTFLETPFLGLIHFSQTNTASDSDSDSDLLLILILMFSFWENKNAFFFRFSFFVFLFSFRFFKFSNFQIFKSIRDEKRRRKVFEIRIRIRRNEPEWAMEDLNFRPHPYQGCALTNWANSPF
jgi:hypothetical protein